MATYITVLVLLLHVNAVSSVDITKQSVSG